MLVILHEEGLIGVVAHNYAMVWQMFLRLIIFKSFSGMNNNYIC